MEVIIKYFKNIYFSIIIINHKINYFIRKCYGEND